jgi:energy-converting hydrogenase Eha subunit E
VSESQKVTQQPALTTSGGGIWLVVAGIIAGLSLIFLWFMRALPPLGASVTGAVIIIVAYLAMLAVRFGVRAPRVRLWSLAVLTIGISITFMTVAIIMVYDA